MLAARNQNNDNRKDKITDTIYHPTQHRLLQIVSMR